MGLPVVERLQVRLVGSAGAEALVAQPFVEEMQVEFFPLQNRFFLRRRPMVTKEPSDVKEVVVVTMVVCLSRWIQMQAVKSPVND